MSIPSGLPAEIPNNNGLIMVDLEPEFESDMLTNRDVRLTVCLELLRKLSHYPVDGMLEQIKRDTITLENFINSVDDQTEREG